MHSTLKRAAAVTGSLIIAASATLVGASAAHADGTYYGAWTLTAWKLGSKTIECPGSLPLPPPAPAISCKGGEYLELKTNYRYKTNLAIFSRNLLSKGDFATVELPNAASRTIVFDADGDDNDPRAYQIKFSGSSSGMPTKMVIYTAVGVAAGKSMMVKMIFHRDAN